MGTTVEVAVTDNAQQCIPHTIALFETLEACWTRFDNESELCRLNRALPGQVPVSKELAEALRAAISAFTFTDGIVNVNIGAALCAAGYSRSFDLGHTKATRAPAPILSLPISVSVDNIVTSTEHVQLDLGGVGKGLAVDIASRWLRQHAASGYVNAGGDIGVFGYSDSKGVPVPLLHPTTGEPFATTHLTNGSIAMSTTAYRTWNTDAGVLHHIIDPRTATSATSDLLAVAVAETSTFVAETAAKTCLILGKKAGTAWLREKNIRHHWLIPVPTQLS